MTQLFKAILLLLPFCSIILSGCSSTANKSSSVIARQDPKQRIAQLTQLKQWKVQGKIAFLKGKERNSATLTWHVNDNNHTQQLSLTSYLGINVLQLDSHNNVHKVQVDGETYQSADLEALIHSLTGFTLPTKALASWLKGIPFQNKDSIIYQDHTQLPLSLTSHYNNQVWQVSYAGFQQIDDYSLATKFSIKKDDLIIKIAINEWSVN